MNSKYYKKQIIIISLVVVSIFATFLSIFSWSAVVNPISLQYLKQETFDGRDLRLVKVLAANDAYTRYYITYMSGKYRISGIMNIPKGKGPYPVIITNHGYINPKYYTNGRGLKREQDYLARHGFAVLHPDYRNHNGSDIDPENPIKLNLGYTEDVINAVYAIKNSSIKSLDKDNIGMLGHSLGGGIALNIMAVKPGLVKAYVLFAPTSIDFKDNYNRWIANMDQRIPQKFGTPDMREEIIKKYGSTGSNPDFWDNMSPGKFINDINDPVIIHQGTSDKDVPYQWAKKLKNAFSDSGRQVKLYLYAGEPHEFINAWPKVMGITTTFFRSYLNVK